MKKIYIFKRNPPPLPIPLVLGALRALSIQPQLPEISVGTSNGTDHFGLVRSEYSGQALKGVHSDRSGHFGQNCCPQYRSFLSCLREQVVSNGKSGTVSKAMTSQIV